MWRDLLGGGGTSLPSVPDLALCGFYVAMGGLHANKSQQLLKEMTLNMLSDKRQL